MLITNRSNEQMVMSVDTGDEIGIRLCRQPPLPPPHPPRTYPPYQLRRWWVNKECIKEMKLSHALNEFKSLFSSSNTYSVKYFDGTYLMPIVNDKDLQSCLRYFVENSSVSSICCLYLEEVPQLQEERKTATVTVTKTLVKKVKEVGERPAADHIQGDARGKKKMVGEEERLRRFKARMMFKHGADAEVLAKDTVTCLYENCKKQISCKEYNAQNFDKHVISCHSNRMAGNDIRTLFTMIAQNARSTQENDGDDSDGES